MQYSIEIKAEVISDLLLAYDYYEEAKIGLGETLLEVIENSFDIIQKHPFHYQVKRTPYREAIVSKFPFVIIYEIIDSKVIIYAVFNTFLNPEKKP